MKKILFLILTLCMMAMPVLGVERAVAVEAVAIAELESDSFYCNIGTGNDCVSLHLPSTDLNEAFCERLAGKQVPGMPEGTEFWATMPEKDDRCEDVTPVPEFTTIGAGIALVGSIGAYLKSKMAKRN